MATLTPNTTPNVNTSTTTASGPNVSSGGKSLTYDQVENFWTQAGGNPQAAAMAAAVASASSGLDPTITRTNPDGTTSVGLWLIPKNGQPPGSTDPLSNARAAVQLSSHGTDWSQWCVAWSDNNCGQDQGTYLGSGSNALAALAGPNESYNVIGSAPSGSNVGASTATSAPGTSSVSTSGHTILVIGLLVVLVMIVLYVSRRAQASAPLEEVPG